MTSDFTLEEIAEVRQIPPEERSVWHWCKLLAAEDPIDGTGCPKRIRYIQAVLVMTLGANRRRRAELAEARREYDAACAAAIDRRRAAASPN